MRKLQKLLKRNKTMRKYQVVHRNLKGTGMIQIILLKQQK
jgi:hypothetical protein